MTIRPTMKYRGRLDTGTTIYNNNKNTFIEEYYSGVDTNIYIDGAEFTEAASISYSVQEQVKPIYGYASAVFDDVAVGTRIIVGSIVVPLQNRAENNYQHMIETGEVRNVSFDRESGIPGWARNTDESILTSNNTPSLRQNKKYVNNNTKIVQKMLASMGYNDDIKNAKSIKKIKCILHSLGYIERSHVDFNDDKYLKLAVSSFQKAKDMNPSGEIDNEFLDSLIRTNIGTRTPDEDTTDELNTEVWKFANNNLDAFFYEGKEAGKNGSTITITFGGDVERKLINVVFRSLGETVTSDGDAIYKQYEFIAQDLKGDYIENV